MVYVDIPWPHILYALSCRLECLRLAAKQFDNLSCALLRSLSPVLHNSCSRFEVSGSFLAIRRKHCVPAHYIRGCGAMVLIQKLWMHIRTATSTIWHEHHENLIWYGRGEGTLRGLAIVYISVAPRRDL